MGWGAGERFSSRGKWGRGFAAVRGSGRQCGQQRGRGAGAGTLDSVRLDSQEQGVATVGKLRSPSAHSFNKHLLGSHSVPGTMPGLTGHSKTMALDPRSRDHPNSCGPPRPQEKVRPAVGLQSLELTATGI